MRAPRSSWPSRRACGATVRRSVLSSFAPPSSSGQGRRPLRSETEIRILLGAPFLSRLTAGERKSAPSGCRRGPNGRLTQRESASFTRKRSGVRIPHRPPTTVDPLPREAQAAGLAVSGGCCCSQGANGGRRSSRKSARRSPCSVLVCAKRCCVASLSAAVCQTTSVGTSRHMF
jgi:hypothetical protein